MLKYTTLRTWGIKNMLTWEFFEDLCYFGLWAVRPMGDRDFNSHLLFHVVSEQEAITLCGVLNGKIGGNP